MKDSSYIPVESSEGDRKRFWKWMHTPLKDVPTVELVWCSQQDQLNSYCSLQGWKAEITRRDRLAANEDLIL